MDINKNLKEKIDKINFLRGLIRVAKCDGMKDDSEIIFYHQAANSLGLSMDDLVSINEAWNTDERHFKLEFTNNKSKMFFFIQAIQLCWMDDSYEDVEKEEIRLIANEIGISETAICHVEEWVEEGMTWNKKGNSLLELS